MPADLAPRDCLEAARLALSIGAVPSMQRRC
jgi:hypothetical protein